MNQIKWILAVLIILAVNNIVLIKWMNYSEDKSAGESQLNVNAVVNKTKSLSSTASEPSVNTSNFEKTAANPAQAVPEPVNSDVSVADEKFIQAFSRASKSDDFAEIFYNIQLNTQKLYQELESSYNNMSPSELLTEFEASSSDLEKQLLFGKLAQNDYAGLDDDQLKRLYLSDDIQPWASPNIINKLLDKGDPDALIWAKQVVTDGLSDQQYLSGEFFTNLYEQAPDFVENYVDTLDIENFRRLGSFSNLFYQDKALASRFLTKNFDKILSSENSNVYQSSSYNVQFDMTRSQEASLVDAFSSSSRHKRNFAINLASNVKNTDLLRDGYAALEKDNDRSNFLGTLLRNRNNAEHKALAKELAAKSNNPDIKRLATYR